MLICVLSLTATTAPSNTSAIAVADATKLAAKSLECSPTKWRNCPKPGGYWPGQGVGKPRNARIWEGPTFYIEWTGNVVPPYAAGTVPAWIKVYVGYWNKTNTSITLVCPRPGPTPATWSKEWFYRNGKYLGYVAAYRTYCTDHPDAKITLPPKGYVHDWAMFANVPWKGDRIAIEWSGFGRGHYIDPYSHYCCKNPGPLALSRAEGTADAVLNKSITPTD